MHWFWHWSTVLDTGVHRYQECPCGRRRVIRVGDGHQPICREWLETGEWPDLSKLKFPTAPSGVQRVKR